VRTSAGTLSIQQWCSSSAASYEWLSQRTAHRQYQQGKRPYVQQPFPSFMRLIDNPRLTLIMPIGTKLKIAAQWFATVTLSALAITFGVNAGDIFFNHDGTPGQMRGFAAVAGIAALIAYHFYGLIGEDRDERARSRRAVDSERAALASGDASGALVASGPESLLLNAGVADAGFVRVERVCPYCAEHVLVAARLCRFCRSELVPLVAVADFGQADMRIGRVLPESHNTPH